MKKYLCLIISLLNAVATAIYIALIDKDIVPIHYDFYGNVDNEGSKWSFMFLPAILVVMAVVFLIIEKVMAKNINYQKNSKYLTICITGFIVLMLAMFWALLILSTNGNGKIIGKVVPFICSVILGLMGVLFSNFMPKIKPNGTFGIRVSATLNNETVWKKTHRFAGKTGMVGSFLVLITGFVSLFCGDFSAVVSIVDQYHKKTPIKDFMAKVNIVKRDGKWLVHDPMVTTQDSKNQEEKVVVADTIKRNGKELVLYHFEPKKEK